MVEKLAGVDQKKLNSAWATKASTGNDTNLAPVSELTVFLLAIRMYPASVTDNHITISGV